MSTEMSMADTVVVGRSVSSVKVPTVRVLPARSAAFTRYVPSRVAAPFPVAPLSE